MSPFDLRGPEFPDLYAGVAAAGLIGAARLRWYLRQPGDDDRIEEIALDPYEIACLSGGEPRVVQTALSRLG